MMRKLMQSFGRVTSFIAEKIPQEKSKEDEQEESYHVFPRDWKFLDNHHNDQILGNSNFGLRTRSSLKDICAILDFLYQIELF